MRGSIRTHVKVMMTTKNYSLGSYKRNTKDTLKIDTFKELSDQHYKILGKKHGMTKNLSLAFEKIFLAFIVE